MEDSLKTNKSEILPIFILIVTTILWGSTFIITKNMISEVPLHFFLGFRFFLSLIPFIPFFPHLKKVTKKEVGAGCLAGIVYFGSILVQTYGLQYTSAGKGGFITGLNTVIVPLIAWLGFKKKIGKRIWIAVALSILGMGLLLLEGESTEILIGDLLVLACAAGFAIYIILVDRDVSNVDIYNYLIIQLVIVSGMCFLLAGIFQENYNIFEADFAFWIIMLYMGAIAAGLTFFFQNWGEKEIGATKTALIFTLEPVMAVFFASYLIGSEQISILGWVGSGLIFSAILIVVFKANNSESKLNYS
ncbi:MAG: DMT family transporter [Promethearchaeota archaeon]